MGEDVGLYSQAVHLPISMLLKSLKAPLITKPVFFSCTNVTSLSSVYKHASLIYPKKTQ
jgi:hypothetical protein